MPLYEYECEQCGRRFERIQKFSDPPLETCPECGGHVHKLMSSPAIQFKGSGWYVTDYARAADKTSDKVKDKDKETGKDTETGTGKGKEAETKPSGGASAESKAPGGKSGEAKTGTEKASGGKKPTGA